MARPKTNTVAKTITLTEDLYVDASKTADGLGISFPEYVRFLIIDDKREYLRRVEVLDEETKREIMEAEEDIKMGRVTRLNSKADIDRHFDELLGAD